MAAVWVGRTAGTSPYPKAEWILPNHCSLGVTPRSWNDLCAYDSTILLLAAAVTSIVVKLEIIVVDLTRMF